MAEYELIPIESKQYELVPVEEPSYWDKVSKVSSAESELAVRQATPRIAGGLAMMPVAGIMGGAKTITSGLEEGYKTYEQFMGLPMRGMAPDEAEAVHGTSELLGKPFEMAGKGWGLIGRETGIPYAEPALGTMGEVTAMVALGGRRAVAERFNMRGLDYVLEPVKEVATPRIIKTKDYILEPVKEAKDYTLEPTEGAYVEGGREVAKVETPQEGVTSIKNAVVNAEREARGLEPVESPVTRTDTWIDDAIAKVDSGDIDPKSIVDRINAEVERTGQAPPLTDEQVIALTYDKTRLKNEHKANEKLFDEAQKAGKDTAELEQKRTALEDAIDANERATTSAGTAQSHAFSARKTMMAEDYSYAGLIQKAKNDGVPITDSLRKRYKDQSTQLEELQIKLKEQEGKISELEADRAIRKLQKDIGKEQRQSTRVVKKQELADEFNVLIKDLNTQLSALHANPMTNPEALAILGQMAKNRVKAGAVRAAEVADYIYTEVQKVGIDLSREQIKEAISLDRALRSYKTRTTNRIAELQEKLERGDFAPKKRRELVKDKEALDLGYRIDKLKRAIEEGAFKDKLAQRTAAQKTGAAIGEAVNTFRAIQTSFDLSAVLRQGGFIFLAHPIRGAKAMPSMFRALTKKGEYIVNKEIMDRPNYKDYEKSGLFLAEHGKKLSSMEEVYMSRWAEKIPGVGASQRAYTTYLNRLRADSFDAMVKNLTKDGKASPKEMDAISNFINVATGRGSLKGNENAMVGLNTAFFAPRYVLSRFQLLGGQPLYRGTWATRKMVAKEYARFLTGLGVVYTLGVASGATIETDPRSSDFGKMKWGNTRIDPLAGLSQTATLLGRELSGGTKKLKSGQVVPIREYGVIGKERPKVPYGGATAWDVLGRFLRTKFSPVVGTAVDVASGKDVVGQKVTPASVPQKLMMPLSFNDVYDVMKEQGIPAGSALTVLSMLGMGLQNFDLRKKNPDTLFEQIRKDID